ncbi:ABC transporter ATP-binding protein [Paenibacillus sacheonensis]|uniref:ATP-binding cassette domain-containing protein n=1 Tax=Paenibacillus sacheonensis TaxID=742054 RepID=A0A7X4YQC8_9BACL|nr:ABC transporter ATP-binding protein [Paenibacillus sacheonensis]MBM7566370.1 ATP-binding cassette subfamily B protein/subfamily B ATP-binding cassette protein MsbA [Paenibacillus sacheonensis]NBC70572.1 ATP-binding cassette domain-containing protein [Paenibacillus sacheonensis]
MLDVYWWSLTYLKPYLGTLVLLVAAMTVVSAAELAVPKIMQVFIDTVIPGKKMKAFYWMLAGTVALLAALIAAQCFQNMFQRGLQENAARDLQRAMFRHLRTLGFAYAERHPTGETLSLLNTEVAAVQNMYRYHFPGMLNGFMFSALSVALMLSSSARLTLIMLPGFLLYYLFGPYLERQASLNGKRMANERVEENRKAYESVSAQTELRAYGAERWDSERYAAKVEALNRSTIRTYWYAYMRGTNRRLTYYLGAVFVFIYGYHLIGKDAITVGEFVAFLLYYFAAMHRLTGVVTNITEQRVLMFQAKRLYDFVRLRPAVTEPDQPEELQAVQGELRFEEVSYAYNPDQPVLCEFSLTVPAGSRVALVGATGSGKSTVLKLAGRFYDPGEGRILLDGVPIDRLSFDALRSAMGYVFQETYLFGSSVRENIRFGDPEASDEAVEAAARAACAHEFIMGLPDGYDTPVGERGVRLSGGQKQRVAIARMFIKQPRVILLDEATSALDNESEAGVQEALVRLMRGRTILAVAHRLSTIRDFDRIVVLQDGRVAEWGTYDELLEKRGLLYRLAEGTTEPEEAIVHV